MKNILIITALMLLLPMGSKAQQAGKAVNPDVYVDSALARFDNGDAKGGLALLKKGVKLGSKLCCNRLGDYYNEKEDYKQAAKWYVKADDPEGWFEHGWLWFQGNLGKQTDAEVQRGLQLMRRSEQAGYRDAVFVTGRLFELGVVLEQNFDSALYMYSRLVEQEDAMALYRVANLYETGKGVEVDSLKAVDFYRRSGAAGLGEGYCRVGDYYRYGIGGVPADSLQAFNTYLLAAGTEQEPAGGMAAVAECYLKGIGTRTDTAKAVYYLRDAVEAGSPWAAGQLADMYNYGLGGIKADGDTAIMLYRLASQGDDPRGDYMMGAYLYEQGAYDNAMGFIASAAQNGSVDAQVLLAQAMLVGNGVDADPVLAVTTLRTLTERDATGQALFMLGIATVYGIGTDADSAEGISLIRRSAEAGNARAMISLGKMYAVGEGVPRDTVEAVRWYERAAEAGSSQAMVQLAGSYLTGQVAPKNPQRAVELYQMAADRGDLDALCRLGLCYEQGEGVTLNSRRAYNLYLQAADRGSAWGMRLVGLCYAQGTYAEQDMKQAAEWLLKSAESGDIQSAYIIGQLYAAGEGVKKNKKEAKRWLTVAAEAGHGEAAEMLKAL